MDWLTRHFAWLDNHFYYNKVSEWLTAAAIAIGCWLLLGAVVWFIRRRLGRREESEDETPWRLHWVLLQVVSETSWFFYLAAALFIGELYLTLPYRSREVVEAGAVVALTIQVGIWLQAAWTSGFEYWRQRQEDTAAAQMAAVGTFLGRLVIWVIVLMLILSNLGVEISALIAALGVGGIAAALAIQSTLGDLMGAFSIYLDKPFRIGDFIIVGDLLGTIERIGMRTTRIRSLSGEQVICPNSDLAKARIRNYTRMRERRIVAIFGVRYSTGYDKLSKIQDIVRTIIDSQPSIRFDRSHFKEYGQYSLVFETVYYVRGADYNLYMEEQHKLNMSLYQRFEEEGIRFAFPTQLLHVESLPSSAQGDTRGDGKSELTPG